MDLPEKEPNTGQAGNKLSIVSFLLLVLLIVCIAFLVYLKNQNTDLKDLNVKELIKSGISVNSSKKPAEKLVSQIEIDSKERPVFDVYKDSILKCVKDNIMCLNQKGEVLWTKSVTINNPMVKVAGSNILVADLNGRFFYVFNGKEIKWEQKVDGNIVGANINEKGYIAIVKEMKGYKGAVEVYDPQGNWAFTSAKGEDFIISAKVLPSSDGVVVSMLDTSGISADTRFEFINMSGKVIGNAVGKNGIFPSMWPLNSDKMAAVSDLQAMIIDSERNVKWKGEYEKIYSSTSALGKDIILAVKKKNAKGVFSGGKTSIEIINSKGDIYNEFEVDGEVLNMEAYGNNIAVNTGREVYFANLKGKLIGKYTSKIDILEVKFFNKEEVAVISKNNIVATKIN